MILASARNTSETEEEPGQRDSKENAPAAGPGRTVKPLIEDFEAEFAEAGRMNRGIRTSTAFAAALLAVAVNFLTNYFLVGLLFGPPTEGVSWAILASGILTWILVFSGVSKLLT